MWTIGIQERREHRSQILGEALHLQLVYAAGLFDYDAFVLVDEDGGVVATSTFSEEGDKLAELLGAFAPMLTHDRVGAERGRLARRWLADELGFHGIGWDIEEVDSHEFYVDGQRLYLVAVGPGSPLSEAGLYRVIFGVRRILAESLQGEEAQAYAG